MKRIIAIAFTLALTVFMVQEVGVFLDPAFSGDCINAQIAFDSLPKDSVDVIVYGSSHAWKGFDVNVLREDYGLTAYNYGSNWQHINTTMLYYYDSLRTQSPKVAIVECSFPEPLQDVDLNGEIYYTRAIKFLPEKGSYLYECFGLQPERYLSYYVPLYAFHNEWTNIDRYNFEDSVSVDTLKRTNGYLSSDRIEAANVSQWSTFEQKDLSYSAICDLDALTESAKQNNIKVIFYVAPFEGEYNYHDAMTAYANSRGCTYLDCFELFDEIGMDEATDFQDTGHLNQSGSAKIARFIGKYIVENKLLE